MRFVIPPQRAVWIPPATDHRILSRSPFWLTTCYIDTTRVDFPAVTASVVAVDRLTNELLIAVGGFGSDGARTEAEQRMSAVLLDCLAGLRALDVFLPMPNSPKLGRLAKRLLSDPACPETLASLAADTALSERTAARLFKAETGLSFGAWRQQVRMQAALEHLFGGLSVTETAFAVGYRDVSSFIDGFRRVFGKTPARILKS